MSTVNGNGNDLIYYKKAKNMARIIQVLYVFFGILIIAMMAITVIGVLMIVVTVIMSSVVELLGIARFVCKCRLLNLYTAQKRH